MEKILLIPSPVECAIVSRVNRFVVKIRIDGQEYAASTNNTGRLHQFLVEGKKAFCLNRQSGKTKYRLFSILDDTMGAIIDTQMQMQAFEKCLELGRIPWLRDAQILRRNARLNTSLIDYLLRYEGGQAYLEVKSAVLRDGKYAMYPDCPTARGRRHVQELTGYVREGGKAFIMFIAALPGVSAFKPDKTADPQMAEALLKAREAGVELKAVSMVYQPKDSFIYLDNPDLPVDLNKHGISLPHL